MSHLNDLLNALAITQYRDVDRFSASRKGKGEKKGKGKGKGKGKDLTLLDGLALLFVRDPTQDVAAMAMIRKQTNNVQDVTFWLAMNGGCDSDSREFAQTIINIANRVKDGEHYSTCIAHLLHFVISYCFNTMERRRAKVAQRLQKLIDDDILNFSQPKTSKALTSFNNRNRLQNGPSPTTWSAWLRNWFECEIKQPFSQDKRTETGSILFTSQSIACTPELFDTLNDKTLQHRMQKLAQYIEIVAKLIRLASAERVTTRFNFESVNLPPSMTIGSLSSPIELYNTIGFRKVPLYEELTSDSIRDAASQITEDLLSSEHNLVTIAHCECVLAIAMISKFHLKRFEIGMSKASCWLCKMFLDELGRVEKTQILVSSTHNKTCGGWQFPYTDSKQHEQIYSLMIDYTTGRIAQFLGNMLDIDRAAKAVIPDV